MSTASASVYDLRRRGPRWAMLLALALVPLVPVLLVPPMAQDSFWIDRVWLDRFVDAMRGGTLWPRWLAGSHGGLGAPVFMFYGPAAFWIAAIPRLLGATAYWSIIAAFVAIGFGSGVAMLRWLRGSPHALLGAAVYMLLPYHLTDFVKRGAIAEATAFIFLPLLADGLRRAADQRGTTLLALPYAGLVMTHLPSALLASLFLIAPLAALHIRRDPRAVWPIVAGIGLGLMLAAAYLLPALFLQRYVSVDDLWRLSALQPANWSLLASAGRSDVGGLTVFAVLAGVIVVGAAMTLRHARSAWGLAAIAYAALAVGLVPGLWSLPLLAKVQFPWRALMLAEFALATAVARAPSPRLWLGLALAPALLMSGLTLASLPSGERAALAKGADVLEYRPAGSPAELGPSSAWALTLAAEHPAPVVQGGRTIWPRFGFPAWQVRCARGDVPTGVDSATRLLTSRGGPDGCTLRWRTLPIEAAGRTLSLRALTILIAHAWRRRSVKRARQST